MKTRKFIKLINDERKDRRILSQKGCSGFATDLCTSVDNAHCNGIAVDDWCNYDLSSKGCSGFMSFDECNKDT